MFRNKIRASKVAVSLSAIAALIPAALPVSAGTQTLTQESLEAAKQKYEIAQTVSKIADKCKFSKDDLAALGLNEVTKAVADISAKDYAELLKANGQDAFLGTANGSVNTALKTATCGGLKKDPTARQYVQSASYLINEVLYAVSLSGVEKCGDVTQHIAPVLGEAKRLAPGTAARADLASFKPMAEKRATEIAEMCDGDNMFDGDYIFMAHDPIGKILIEMGKFMK